MRSPSWCWREPSIRPSGHSAWNGLCCSRLRNNFRTMTQTALSPGIRVNGEEQPLTVATLAALLEEKAVDVQQRGIAVALNGQVVPRADWPATALRPGDSVEIVRARQGG